MTGAAVLTLIATVLAAEGISVEVDIGLESGLRPGDRGVVFYVVGEGDDLLRYEVGEGQILNASAYRATLTVDPEARVEPGHLVRFQIPEERLSRPSPPGTMASQPRSGTQDNGHTVYLVRDGVFPCLNVRTHAAMESPVVDCLPSGTRVGLIDETRGWKKVVLGGGAQGWTVARYLQVDLGSGDKPLEPRPEGRLQPEPPPVEAAGSESTRLESMPEPLQIRQETALEQELGSAREQEADMRDRLESSEASLDESQRLQEEQARRLAALEADLSALERRNAELARETEALESGQAEAAADPTAAAADDSGFQVHLAALEERARQLRDEASGARTALAAAERQLADMTRGYEAVRLEKETLAGQVEALELVRSRLESDLAIARSNESSAVERADRLESELSQATARITTLTGDLENNKSDLTEARVEVARIQGLIDASKDDLDRSEQDRSELEGSLAGAESEARSLEAARLELHGLLADEVGAREELETEVTELKAGLDAAQTELEASRAETAALRSRLEESASLADRGDGLEDDLLRVSEERDLQIGRVETLERDLTALGEELAAARSERDELESRMAAAAASGEGLPPIPMLVSPTMTACLRVRMGPSLQDEVVDCLAPGTELLEVERAPEWRRVRSLGNREGWVSEAFVEPDVVEREVTVILEGGDR